MPLTPLVCLSGLCHLTGKHVDVAAVAAAATGGAAAAAVGIEDVDEHQSLEGIPFLVLRKQVYLELGKVKPFEYEYPSLFSYNFFESSTLFFRQCQDFGS